MEKQITDMNDGERLVTWFQECFISLYYNTTHIVYVCTAQIDYYNQCNFFSLVQKTSTPILFSPFLRLYSMNQWTHFQRIYVLIDSCYCFCIRIVIMMNFKREFTPPTIFCCKSAWNWIIFLQFFYIIATCVSLQWKNISHGLSHYSLHLYRDTIYLSFWLLLAVIFFLFWNYLYDFNWITAYAFSHFKR